MPIRGEGDRAGQLRLRRHVARVGARHAAAEAGHAGAGLTAPGIQPLESGIGQARTGRHQIGRRAAIGAHHRIQRQHATIEQRGHAGTIERLELQHLPVILIHPAEVGARPVEPAAKACAVHEGQVRGVLLGREQALFGFGVQLALPFLPGRGEVEAEGGRGAGACCIVRIAVCGVDIAHTGRRVAVARCAVIPRAGRLVAVAADETIPWGTGRTTTLTRTISATGADIAPRARSRHTRGRVRRNRAGGSVRTDGTRARPRNGCSRNAGALGRTGRSLSRSPCGPFCREPAGTALSRRTIHTARSVSVKGSRSIETG